MEKKNFKVSPINSLYAPLTMDYANKLIEGKNKYKILGYVNL